MHQFVQSAIEAANQGDKNKAIDFIKQVLSANPNDVDAWLVLAAVVDEPERKRQCLKRVLTLDPVNQLAREELLEMDRAAMGGNPTFMPDIPPVSPIMPQSVDAPTIKPLRSQVTQPAPSNSIAQPKPKASAKLNTEKALVFKYPLVWRILMYVFTAVFGCVGLLMLTQSEFSIGLFFLGFAVLMLIALLTLFPTVEVSSAGIRASGIFSSSETGWDEIVKIKSNAMKRRLELTKRNKQVVNVSTQVSGYPQIVDTLQKKRPDLFGIAPVQQTQSSAFPSSENDETSTGYGSASPSRIAPAFKGTRTFKKNFFRQYGSYIFIIPLCLLATFIVFTDRENLIGAGLVGIACIAGMLIPLFQVSMVKVAGNKLIIETLFEEKSFAAKEIREIKMKTVRGRYGSATNYVNILLVTGRNYPLQAFSDGEEIIYGVLTNWWNANQNG